MHLKQYASVQPSNQIKSNFSRQSSLNEHTYLNTNISACQWKLIMQRKICNVVAKLSVFKVVHVILIHNKSVICQKERNRNSDIFPLLLYVNYIQFGGELHLEFYTVIIKFTYNEIGRCNKLVLYICIRVVKNRKKIEE